MRNDIIIFSGSSNPALAKEICEYLGISPGLIQVRRFSDGEIQVEVGENVRGRDIFVIQSTCRPVNDNMMELLIMMDALKRASARRITAVIPYYGYARQDRKSAPRVPISAKLVADLITVAGAKRVLSIDLHAGQIQGFFDIPVDHLFAAPVFMKYFRDKQHEDMVVVSPDAGGVERARAYAKRLNASIAIVDKRREAANVAKAMNLIGEVAGKTAIIVDDMIDTAGSLTQAAELLLEKGAREVMAYATHPVFSGPALDRIESSVLGSVLVTNSVPLSEKGKASPRIHVLSVASLLGEAIRRINQEDSVSSLFV